jgi:signal transduction histidine kinase
LKPVYGRHLLEKGTLMSSWSISISHRFRSKNTKRNCYGTGISEETSERLFDRFFTTKPEGLGMGLAIVRSIMESHAGSIVAENAKGAGARFHFTLPIKAAD